jgi:hypothetical protein
MKPVILTVSPLLAFIGCPFGTLTAPAPDDEDEPAPWLFALLGPLAPQAAMTATAINVIAATAVLSPRCRLVIEAMGRVTPTWKRSAARLSSGQTLKSAFKVRPNVE